MGFFWLDKILGIISAVKLVYILYYDEKNLHVIYHINLYTCIVKVMINRCFNIGMLQIPSLTIKHMQSEKTMQQ